MFRQGNTLQLGMKKVSKDESEELQGEHFGRIYRGIPWDRADNR